MGRPALEVTKNKLVTVRLEPEFRIKYSKFCKKNKFKMATRIRQFMIDDLDGKFIKDQEK